MLALIRKGNKILLGKKRAGPHPIDLGGKWHFPGGRLRWGETPRQALTREIKEETGLDIKISKIIDVSINKRARGFGICIWCECFLKGQKEPRALTDIIAVQWMDKNEILNFLDSNFIKILPNGVVNYLK